MLDAPTGEADDYRILKNSSSVAPGMTDVDAFQTPGQPKSKPSTWKVLLACLVLCSARWLVRVSRLRSIDALLGFGFAPFTSQRAWFRSIALRLLPQLCVPDSSYSSVKGKSEDRSPESWRPAVGRTTRKVIIRLQQWQHILKPSATKFANSSGPAEF